MEGICTILASPDSGRVDNASHLLDCHRGLYSADSALRVFDFCGEDDACLTAVCLVGVVACVACGRNKLFRACEKWNACFPFTAAVCGDGVISVGCIDMLAERGVIFPPSAIVVLPVGFVVCVCVPNGLHNGGTGLAERQEAVPWSRIVGCLVPVWCRNRF